MSVPQSTKHENLPAVVDDGFDEVGAGEDRLIQGEILRCTDGHWALRDGTAIPPETRFSALGTALALQHWDAGMPVETIVKRPNAPLPDLNELNAAIPKAQWEEGFDGNPRPPWVRQHVVYLLNLADASVATFINSTVGAAIAVSRLKDRVRWMRQLRGERIVPVVKLDSKPMKTKFGQKMRPEFTIIEWRAFGGLQAPVAAPAIEHVGQRVEEPSLKEELNDGIPGDAAPWEDQRPEAETPLDADKYVDADGVVRNKPETLKPNPVDDDRSAEAAKARLTQFRNNRRRG
jgi:hypothetical protein